MDRSNARRTLSSVPDDQFVAAIITVLKTHRHRGCWLSIDDVARLAEMSVRSLQRRLAEEGVVFSELVQRARHELAVQWIVAPSLSLSEIGVKLGYSKVSNFSRAFQRWTGKSPAEFRRER